MTSEWRPTRERILVELERVQRPMKAAALGKATGVATDTVARTLHRMEREGVLRRFRFGVYGLGTPCEACGGTGIAR